MSSLITRPIWQDLYWSTDADVVNYRIELDGENIYTGKAYKYPDADRVRININKICRNYLESDIAEMLLEMPDRRETLYNRLSQRVFNLYADDEHVADYQLYLDYSYDWSHSMSGPAYVSKPINGHYVPGMLRMETIRYTSLTTASASTVATECSCGEIEDDDDYLGYTKQVKCAPYVLYYLNSYGGWDAFVIEGNVFKEDSYTTYTTDRATDNTTLDFELNKYVNEINTSYQLNTNYLSDEQSENLAKNLLGSVKVYLHNIDEGWVKPVIITDSKVAYQTYQTNGMKLSQYRISVKESRTKIRKG